MFAPSAYTSDVIVTARGFAQPSRGFLEDGIANEMALGIVDLFKMIEVCDEGF